MGISTMQPNDDPRGVDSSTPKKCRVPLGSLGKPHVYLRRVALLVRRDLEQAYAAQSGGVIGVAAASRIATACTALRQAARIDRILRDAGEPGVAGGLTHAEWVAYSDRLVRYRQAADQSIAALGLDSEAKPRDPWAAVYAPPALQASPLAASEPAIQGDSYPGDDDAASEAVASARPISES